MFKSVSGLDEYFFWKEFSHWFQKWHFEMQKLSLSWIILCFYLILAIFLGNLAVWIKGLSLNLCRVIAISEDVIHMKISKLVDLWFWRYFISKSIANISSSINCMITNVAMLLDHTNFYQFKNNQKLFIFGFLDI